MVENSTETLKSCLESFKKSWSDFDNLTNLLNKWSLIVGKELSNQCKPLKIEKNILTIVANHPQWRQALIYNKHKLKESIRKIGIDLKNIRIIQSYHLEESNKRLFNMQSSWDNHPSRIKKNAPHVNCKYCNTPTPLGEIERWGKCTFCWRKNN